MADELCPTCHSQIGTQSTVESERAQGKQGTDDNNNPIPRWTDDPIITLNGFSGDTYLGRPNVVRNAHIKEIQETRVAQEDESEVDPTDFSDIGEDKHITRRHIIELRESTEKILNASGTTLEEYFKLDDDGVEQTQNPKIIGTQVEWVDVERGAEYATKDGSLTGEFTLPNGSTIDSPTLPTRIHIRAIHIEDLRHPIAVGIPAILVGSIGFLNNIGQQFGFFGGDTVFKGVKNGGANFKGLFSCADSGVEGG